MSLWPTQQKTDEQLARLDASAQDQLRALNAQQSTLAGLTERLAQLQRDVSALGAKLPASTPPPAEPARDVVSDVPAALKRVRHAIKGLRDADKRTMQHVRRLLDRLAGANLALDPSVDPDFLSVAHPLVEGRRTMLGFDRLYTLWQAARNVAALDLPSVEVGSFRGGSAALIADALQLAGGGPRSVHVVDTFEGHLDSTLTEHDPDEQRGKFRTVSVDEVKAFLASRPQITVHQGDAAGVIASWPERQYAMVHIDVDLYGPTLACLEYFGARVAAGGVIVLDDFDASTCPGVARAAGEYLQRTPGFQLWRLQPQQAFLVKVG